MKGAKNSLNGGYNVERASAAHLHPLPHFLVIHFPHPIIMSHPSPHPHFLGCPSPPPTIPEPLYLQPLQKDYTPHPPFLSQYVFNHPQNIKKKRRNKCFCAHTALIFGKNSAPSFCMSIVLLIFARYEKYTWSSSPSPPFFGLSIIQVGLHPTP